MSSLGGGNDFGDLTVARRYLGGVNDSTRGVFAGGDNPSNVPAGVNTMDFVTIPSTGDATGFGSLMQPTNDLGSCITLQEDLFLLMVQPLI